MIKEHYIHKEPKVYWAEDIGLGWNVLSGYYLGSYSTHFGIKHIVTLGYLDSCVVRHLDNFYLTKKEAWTSIVYNEVEE